MVIPSPLLLCSSTSNSSSSDDCVQKRGEGEKGRGKKERGEMERKKGRGEGKKGKRKFSRTRSLSLHGAHKVLVEHFSSKTCTQVAILNFATHV